MVKRTGKIVAGALGGAVVVLGGAYVVSYFVAGNQVPVHASVDGVAIGGMSPDEAEQTLRAKLGPDADAALTLSAGERSAQIVPAEAGLSVDYGATIVDAGGGFSWNPVDIFHALTGGGEVTLVRHVDDAALTQAVSSQAATFQVAAVDATVSFDAGRIVRTAAVDGEALNVDKSADAVASAFSAGQSHAEAALDTSEPAITDAMADEAVTGFAEPLVSGPVVLTHGDTSMEISPAALAEAATFTQSDGKLVGSLDADKLFTSTAEAQKALKLTPAKDATFAFEGAGVKVVPAVVGEVLNKESFTAGVEKAATASGGDRTAAVAVDVLQPTYTTEQATSLGSLSIIGSFTTNFPYAAYRNTNLGRAAEMVNGSVLMPDEIFSLNDTLGERTAANGFVDGYVINGGRLVKEPGGGISQSATTLFNAAFFAGYKDVEHKPHSLYFPRYPAGRESTIYYGSLDMRFQNDTKFPAIIRGYVKKASSGNQGSITFEIWSKPTYDKIVSTDIVKSNFYSGKERVVTGDPKCEPQAPIQGFTASWKRLFYKDGKVVRTEPSSWTYNAGDRIVCK